METEQNMVSHPERERALAALRSHFEAGRLHSFEYEDRRGRAGDATVRSELDSLFTDLPPVDAESDTAPGPGRGFGIGCADAADGVGRSRCGSRGAAYTWVPLLATALFFITGSWVWFLMIPAIGCFATQRTRAGSGPVASGSHGDADSRGLYS